jgi:aminoglycoside/choline kinase family phosphotransferase
MTDRTRLANQFLQNTDWAQAERKPLAGDASRRRYERLTLPNTGQKAVLMDAPPEEGEDVRPFIRIAEHLCAQGFSAPRIFHRDEAQGFLLLEDLGDDLFARVVQDKPELEPKLYGAATDCLVTLHNTPMPEGLAPYDTAMMTDLAALSYDWYLDALADNSSDTGAAFREKMSAFLDQHITGQSVLIQRDYHSENLLWLPDREGVARVGLLDFQDAMSGHRAYDLVSLLQDARRDVPPEIETAMISHYLGQTGLDRDTFEAAYHLLGVQRNLRIVGVFVRLCIRDGKAHYVGFIPRVWDYIQRSLAHPALQQIATIINADLPAPTPDNLKKLKDQCASIPTQ